MENHCDWVGKWRFESLVIYRSWQRDTVFFVNIEMRYIMIAKYTTESKGDHKNPWATRSFSSLNEHDLVRDGSMNHCRLIQWLINILIHRLIAIPDFQHCYFLSIVLTDLEYNHCPQAVHLAYQWNGNNPLEIPLSYPWRFIMYIPVLPRDVMRICLNFCLYMLSRCWSLKLFNWEIIWVSHHYWPMKIIYNSFSGD